MGREPHGAGGRAGGAGHRLLVSLGLIDLGFYTDSGQTAENTRAFVAAARAANPGCGACVPGTRSVAGGPGVSRSRPP
ncbi:hypothetical protein BKD26_02725 [Streptomyces sp. CB03238]|nr:hypothetical protein BKD26_02725 [Streptomyces sp. CB03238]